MSELNAESFGAILVERFGAVDADVVKLPQFADVVSNRVAGKITDVEAVTQMRAAGAVFFKPFEALDDKQFAHVDASVRAGTRSVKSAPKLDIRDVDAAGLSDREFRELEKALRGRVNGYDAGLVNRARERQRNRQ